MMPRRFFVGAAIAAASVAAADLPAQAGTSFRLEVGRPIAASSPGFKSKVVKDAVFVVRPLACVNAGEPEQAVISATAEGIVNGARRSIPLELVRVDPSGVHAVVKRWKNGGTWVVNVSATCQPRKATAAAIVPIVDDSGFSRESTQLLERAATAAEIEVALSAAAKAPAGTRTKVAAK